MPVGLMVWSGALQDDAVLDASLAIEAALAAGARLTMRVAVIGAGIVGVTTAYELAADGHEVTVFERRGSVAAEASFANAGVVAPGYVTPWAAPGMPRKVLAHLLAPPRAGAPERAPRCGGPSPGCGVVARLPSAPVPGQPRAACIGWRCSAASACTS